MSGKFYTVLTFHGTLLFANRADGYIVNSNEGRSGLSRVYLYLPEEDSEIAYLLADLPEKIPLRLHPQPLTGSIVPIGITRKGLGADFGLYSLISQSFVVAAEPASATAIGHVIVVSADPFAYERMRALPVVVTEVPAPLVAKASFINQVGGASRDVDRLLEFCERSTSQTPGIQDVINAVGFTYRTRHYEQFAKALSLAPNKAENFYSIFPGDIWAQYGAPQAIAWKRRQTLPILPSGSSPTVSFWRRLMRPRHDRQPADASYEGAVRSHISQSPATNLEIGQEFDVLQSQGARGEYVSLPQAVTFFTRRSINPEKVACVLATARNEGLYIVEWVAHYKALGFEHLFIYSNDNIDGSDAILSALAEKQEITWIQNKIRPGGAPQLKAYNHALQILPEILNYEWTLVADLDEYLNFNPDIFGSVQDYIAWASVVKVDCIAFNWAVPGSNGESHWRDLPLRRRFPSRNRPQDIGFHYSPLVKSMFRTSKFPVSMPHHPLPFKDENFVFRSASMRPYVFNENEGQGQSTKIDVHNAWMTHYFYKSNEEFLVKFSRSRGDAALVSSLSFDALDSGFIKSFMSQARSGYPQDQHIAFDDRHDREIARLLGDPKVKAAHLESRRFYADRLVTLLPLAATAKGIIEAGDAGEAFMKPLLERTSLTAHSG